jgi:predicted O-methyltransferase YrrM
VTTPEDIAWCADDELRIGDTEFQLALFGPPKSTSRRFLLLKNRPMVEAYIDLAAALRPRHVIELGIFAGGSTALLELLMRPTKLVAFELASERVQALDDFLHRRGAAGRVVPYYGIDQGDPEQILSIVRDHFGSTALDLVVDDASHELALTRKSFDLLFPLLRTGGVYVVEDWGWGHFRFARERRGPSLAKLVLELVLTLPYSEDLIASVTVDKHWAVVRRGPAAVDPAAFEIEQHVSNRARQLLAASDEDPRFLQA